MASQLESDKIGLGRQTVIDRRKLVEVHFSSYNSPFVELFNAASASNVVFTTFVRENKGQTACEDRRIPDKGAGKTGPLLTVSRDSLGRWSVSYLSTGAYIDESFIYKKYRIPRVIQFYTIFIHVFTLDGHVLDTDVNWLFPTENVSFLPAGKPQKAINVIFSLLFSNNSLGCNRCKL